MGWIRGPRLRPGRGRRAAAAATLGALSAAGVWAGAGSPPAGAAPAPAGRAVLGPGVGPPATAPWGLGITPVRYADATVWVVPHPDDEGGLWADQLGANGHSFPVLVFLTNGENAVACTADGPLLRAPAGNLTAGTQPPFNSAGDIPGAPAGYLGAGLPPEYFGAQGNDPPVFPVDPPLTPSTGWAPLALAGSVGAPGVPGGSEGFDGPCRAARLASMTTMLSGINRTVTALGPAAAHALFPSVRPGQPPDGQTCFSAPAMNESYVSQKGRYATPGPDGSWVAAATPAGQVSPKDACAYYWLTPTGDVFAFNLGDASSGFRTACPSDLGGRLRTGPAWPGGTNGYDSIGSYSPGGTVACGAGLPGGQEGYGVTPSDVVWAVQQVTGSGRLPAGLGVAGVYSTGYVNGFNPAEAAPNGAAGPDVTASTSGAPCVWLATGGSSCPPASPPPGACAAYAPAGHMAAALGLQWNQPLGGVRTGVAVCSGDPLAVATFGTTDRADGIRFWTQVFNFDGGIGWEVASRAYGWLTGPGAFDPYGPVTDTCPGSLAVVRAGPSQWSCQESLTRGTGLWPAVPGEAVEGMNNLYPGGPGQSFTRGM